MTENRFGDARRFKQNRMNSCSHLNMKSGLSFDPEGRMSVPVENEDEEADKNEKDLKLRGPEAPLYNAICPMVYAIRIFGFAPYEFDKNNLAPSTMYFGFTIVALIFYTYVFVTVISRFMLIGVRDHEAPILGATEEGKVILNYFVLLLHLVETVLNRKKFADTWNSIADFDECLKRKGYVRSEYPTKVRMWITVVCNIVIWFSVNQAGMQAFFEPWYKNVSYMLLYVANAASLLKYIGMTFLLGQRFQFLNELAGKDDMAMKKDESKLENDIKWIEVMFSELMTISEKFIADHTWSLFLWIFNLGIHSVSNLYFLLVWCSTEDVDIPYYLVWCLISWLFAYISQMVVLHVCCHFTSSEANYMAYVLLDRRKMMMLNGGNYNINLQSTLHLLNRKLKFLAAGCFNVNLPLLRSIIGVSTTYLVILMQLPDEKDVRRRGKGDPKT